MNLHLAILLPTLLVAAPPPEVAPPEVPPPGVARPANPDPPKAAASFFAEGEAFMVAAAHPLASEAGAEILARGGNVVDAAVATSFALGVVRPHSSGIGGGGFMTIHLVDQGSFALDFREIAPASARASQYLDDDGAVVPMRSTTGVWSVGVPGHVRGMQAALERFGSMSLAEVLPPAIRYAREGFEVDSLLADAMASALARAEAFERLAGLEPGDPSPFDEFRRVYLKDGRPYEVGDRLVQPEQAATLEAIARDGIGAFYDRDGSIATRIEDAIASGGGPMTAQDLADYRVRWRAPLVAELAGRFASTSADCTRTVVAMPPPSSGGACLLQALLALDGLPAIGDPEGSRRFVEAVRHAFADRAALLGDADATPEVADDVRRMLEAAHLERLREAIVLPPRSAPLDCGLAGLSSSEDDASTREPATLPEDGGTSHFSVIDAHGNAVAGTDTVNLAFGSLVVPAGTGFVLNDQMDDFAIRTDVANDFGLLMSERNLLAGGRRPLSSMSPTIVLEQCGDGPARATIVAGAAGGPRIITATLGIVIAMLDGATAGDAVAAPRLHHQWMPDRLLVEPQVFPSLRELLTLAKHVVREVDGLAIAQAAARREGRVEAASDPRGIGRPAGR